MNTHLANISSLQAFGAADTSNTGKPSLFARAVNWLADLPRRQREGAELAQFTDRELADIGLNRGDLDRVQTPEFAADYNQGRKSAMFFIRA